MEEADGKLNTGEAPLKTDDATAGTVKIALRAAYWFLFCCAFVCALLTAFFPYGSMKVYAKLGMRNLTREKAQHVVAKQINESCDKDTGTVAYSFKGERPEFDSKFADALYYYAIPLSVERLGNQIEKNGIAKKSTIKSAERVVRNADIYKMFASTRADEAWETAAIAYATETGAASAHPDLYSFQNIVRKNYMRAKYIAYPSEIPAEFTKLNWIITDAREELDAASMDEYAIAFAELNAVINLELDLVGYKGSGTGSNLEQILTDGVTVGSYFRYLYSKTSFTERGETFGAGKQEVLRVLEQGLAGTNPQKDLKAFIYNYNTGNDPAQYLRRAYWARQLSLLTQNIRIVTDILYADRGLAGTVSEAEIGELKIHWTTIYDWYALDNGGHGHAYDWYDRILKDYTSRATV